MTYKLLTCEYRGAPEAAILVEDRVYPLREVEGYGAVLAVLDDWERADPILRQAAQDIRVGTARPSAALSEIRLLAPILYPGAIYCIGSNYRDHAVEMRKAMNIVGTKTIKDSGEKPWHFVKPARSTVVGFDDVVHLPTYSKKVDWEVELAVVIGKRARNVSAAEARDHIAGYTIANDLSARDASKRENIPITLPFHWDRISSKCFEGACPMGPWITPAHDIDAANARIQLWLNDELKQDSNTGQMMFDPAEQIEMLSSRLTLHPGDVILTGTPVGTGTGHGEFFKSGDVVRMAIEGIGEMRHSVTT